MKNTVNDFINFIKEKTSVCLSVYDLTGNLILGERTAPKTVAVNFNSELIDDEGGYILFRIRLSGGEYIALIFGVDGFSIKISKLIGELAKTFVDTASEMTKKQFFSALLSNSVNFSVVEKNVKKYSVPDKSCFVTLVKLPSDRVDEVESVIEDYIEQGVDMVVKSDTDELSIVRFFSGTDEYKSPTEYADFLLKSIYEECGIKGSAFAGAIVDSPYEIGKSYALSREAKDCAEILGGEESAHSFKEYVLTKAVRELSPQKTDEYFRLLLDDDVKKVFSDEEIMETAEEFLENNLNASETARKIYVHRNTLMYRLDKIEKVTGLNIRNFADAVTFRFMTILYKASKR